MTTAKSTKHQLTKAFCSRCGTSLDGSTLVPISEMPLITIAHVVCGQCDAENMVTITSIGTGVMPLVSDLESSEVLRFSKASAIELSEVLEVHKKLKEKSLCDLLQQKENTLEKKQKN